MTAKREGKVLWVNNEGIARVAGEAGAPKEKGAGVVLKVKLDEYVRKNQVLFEIYAERSTKLEAASELAKKLQPLEVSRRLEEKMLIGRVPTKISRERTFATER